MRLRSICAAGATLVLLGSALAFGAPEVEGGSAVAPAGSTAGAETGSTNRAGRGPKRGQRGSSEQSYTFHTQVPAHSCDIILSRPTATGITLSILAYAPIRGFVRYGLDPDSLSERSANLDFPSGTPERVVLENLKPNTRYFYTFEATTDAGTPLEPRMLGQFHTQRAPGAAFTFTVQADSHLDGATNPAIYEATLRDALVSQPDFHIDLGDTFMTDKHPSRESALAQYLAQRYYFGSIAQSAPLFLVLGNHDGELRRLASGTDGLAHWSNAQRKRYFPNPVPDGFYTGNLVEEPGVGLLENYYAWTWGDALFIVLDPFWHSGSRGNASPWERSLGEPQYRWLAETLAASKAPLKFIFIHHLAGGNDRNARGGAEASRYFEWGGHELDGTDTFNQHRAGWSEPIHELLVRHGVSVVFHGHDHFFMKQERDGIVYQLVPQPGHKGEGSVRSATEYGYQDGDIVPGTGHLRVAVTPGEATVSFMRRPLPTGNQTGGDAECAYTYTVSAK